MRLLLGGPPQCVRSRWQHHVCDSRHSAQKKKFARRGLSDLSELDASLPRPGLSGAAQVDLAAGGFSLCAVVSLGFRRSPTPPASESWK
ncbi:T-Cell Activation Rho Gtpase-Activating Protein [Manis pentadactyla]|nr:T-Cell Activation Rho Gtpase-Activating Protein [Manis pentadactyla]